METQTPLKKKRVRKRSLLLQIQAALDAAERMETLGTREADVTSKRLVQTRLEILDRMQQRAHREDKYAKIKALQDEVVSLIAECERLKAELSVARIEIQRVQTVRTNPFGSLDAKLKAISEEACNV